MRAPFLLLLAALVATPAVANDGYAGLGAGGLEFGKSQSIELLTEDLFLSRSAVRVDYAFRNAGAKDESVIVAFQLPPFAPGGREEDFALPEALRQASDLNYMDFSATVDGKPRALQREVRFFLPNAEQPWLWGLAALADPGAEVTEHLTGLGVPLTFDLDAIHAWYAGLPARDRKALLDEGSFQQGENGPSPAYLVSVRFWWRQDFKAGELVRIHHAYTPVLGGSVYYVSPELEATFCIDKATRKAMDKLAAKVMAPDSKQYLLLSDLEYVLTTAATWKGPIGVFRLTLDKEDPGDLVSLCADGIKKTAPTTFVMEKSDWTPTEDLRVLFVDVGPIE